MATRTEQIVGEFLLKSAALVREARSSPSPEPGQESRASRAGSKSKTNRWFNLHVDECATTRAAFEAQTKFAPGSALRLVVRLVDADDGGPAEGTSLELWTIQHCTVPPRPASPARPCGMGGGGRQDVPVVYKRTVVMLRALYCLLRALPAHYLARACQRNQLATRARVECTLLPPDCAPPPMLSTSVTYGTVATMDLTPVRTADGHLSCRVDYVVHPHVPDALRALPPPPPPLPTAIIANYVDRSPPPRAHSLPLPTQPPNPTALSAALSPPLPIRQQPGFESTSRTHGFAGGAAHLARAVGSVPVSLLTSTLGRNSSAPSSTAPCSPCSSPPSPTKLSAPSSSSPSFPLAAHNNNAHQAARHRTSPSPLAHASSIPLDPTTVPPALPPSPRLPSPLSPNRQPHPPQASPSSSSSSLHNRSRPLAHASSAPANFSYMPRASNLVSQGAKATAAATASVLSVLSRVKARRPSAGAAYSPTGHFTSSSPPLLGSPLISRGEGSCGSSGGGGSSSPNLPFAFTPTQMSFTSSLLLHDKPFSGAEYAGGTGRYALTPQSPRLRRPSWSPGSSITGQQQFSAAAVCSISPVCDSGMSSSLIISPDAGAAHAENPYGPLRLTFRPKDRPGEEEEAEEGELEDADALPFALDTESSSLLEVEELWTSSRSMAAHSSDVAVGALIRMMQDAPPLRPAGRGNGGGGGSGNGDGDSGGGDSGGRAGAEEMRIIHRPMSAAMADLRRFQALRDELP